MKVVWTRDAQIDAAEAFAYLAERSPKSGKVLEKRILAAVARLAQYPFFGPIGIVEDTRQLFVPQTKYKVIYAVGAERIRILRVMHGARRWPPAD